MRLSLYVEGTGWVHRLDPLTKVIIAATAVVLTFVLTDYIANAAILLGSLTILISAGAFRRALPVLSGVLVLAVSFFIVQGLVHPGNETPFLTLGPVVFYREGLLVGLGLTLRLYNILSATLIIVLATHPTHLVEALVRRGLSPRFGYVLMAVLQIVPIMADRVGAITDAQRSRGMETEGSLWTRIRAFIPLLGPLVTSSLISTEERALALEVRGFASAGKPTFLREEQVPGYAFVLRWLALILLIGGGVARWGLGWH
jgi:energy-coupling factor transport system permease protein